jgi:hypothetical protein
VIACEQELERNVGRKCSCAGEQRAQNTKDHETKAARGGVASDGCETGGGGGMSGRRLEVGVVCRQFDAEHVLQALHQVKTRIPRQNSTGCC